MLIAHRGIHNSNIKENTINSFIEAINNPLYIGFELDIRETKDHEFIVTHDFFYNNNLISKTNSIDLINNGFCTLKDVLSLDTNKIIIIDIKDINTNVLKLSTILNNSNKNIYVMSYNKKILKDIKPYVKKFKLGLLNMIFNSESDYSNYDFVAILYSVLTDNIIDFFNKNNIELFTYGITNNSIIKNHNLKYIIDCDKEYKFI